MRGGPFFGSDFDRRTPPCFKDPGLQQNCSLLKVGTPELEVMAISIWRLDPLGSQADAVSSLLIASPEIFRKSFEKTMSPFWPKLQLPLACFVTPRVLITCSKV